MFPGKFEICVASEQEGSDAPLYRSLSFGYDTEAEAIKAAPEVAKKANVDLDDIAIIGARFYRDIPKQP